MPPPSNGGAKLLGGPGSGPFILAHPGGQTMPTYPPASRVSFSDLLCEMDQANTHCGHIALLSEPRAQATLRPAAPSSAQAQNASTSTPLLRRTDHAHFGLGARKTRPVLRRTPPGRLQATMSLSIGAAVAPPNGLELSCPAEAGSLPLLYGTPAGQASSTKPQPAGSASASCYAAEVTFFGIAARSS